MARQRSRLVIAKESPLNAEARIEALRAQTTPTQSFYVRSHFETPRLRRSAWRLEVGGEVRSPRVFTYGDLARREMVTVSATLECAGNGRRGFGTAAEGEVRWGHGAVGNAAWTGVPLRQLLGECRPAEGATEVVFEGADSGQVAGVEGRVAYSRSLPIGTALSQDTIVALRMNGATLNRSHGYPARLLVPRWYGMASVKWLTRITVVRGRAYHAYFNGVKYVYVTGSGKGESREPVREMRVKSVITRPLEAEKLRARGRVVIEGKAWSGSGRIDFVEVNKGKGWERATLGPQSPGGRSWVSWRRVWHPPGAGAYLISSRAADEAGNVQPLEPFENRHQYGFNAVVGVRVRVA